jgi:hypothetical protein
MKKIYFIALSLLLSSIAFSCSDKDVPISKETASSTLTRALSANDSSISNPTLHSNWENVDTIYLNGGGQIDAPWIVKGGNSMNIPENYRTDIKKEDGWIMLSHTLLSQSSSEPNYILLYNPNRGIVKGFYYNLENIKNQSFIWVMEATNPTSIFPSNTLIQNPLNTTNSYATTSNIVESSQFSFGALNQGWNAFSFELPYGTTNNAPIIAIKGYNNESSTVTLSGTYSGEVIIPITSTQSSSASSIVSAIKTALSAVASSDPVLSSINQAVSVASSILGSTSLFKSKTSITNIRATSSGKINLTGSSFTEFGGTATSINDIDIKKLNNSNELGLWSLNSNPVITYPGTVVVDPISVESNGKINYYEAYLNYNEPNIKSLITINPLVKNKISNYNVEYTLFSQSALSFINKTNATNYHTTEFYYYLQDHSYNSNSGYTFLYDASGVKEALDSVLINITVTFTYNDGSSFISSRVFKPIFQQIDNQGTLVNSLTKAGRAIRWVKAGGPLSKMN